MFKRNKVFVRDCLIIVGGPGCGQPQVKVSIVIIRGIKTKT